MTFAWRSWWRGQSIGPQKVGILPPSLKLRKQGTGTSYSCILRRAMDDRIERVGIEVLKRSSPIVSLPLLYPSSVAKCSTPLLIASATGRMLVVYTLHAWPIVSSTANRDLRHTGPRPMGAVARFTQTLCLKKPKNAPDRSRVRARVYDRAHVPEFNGIKAFLWWHGSALGALRIPPNAPWPVQCPISISRRSRAAGPISVRADFEIIVRVRVKTNFGP